MEDKKMKGAFRGKRSQAAMEFLMTYGWMLLVVLIVGALIFSFVDFSSILPNRLELTNLLRGDPAGSMVSAGSNEAQIVITNIGGRRLQMFVNSTEGNSTINPDIGSDNCIAEHVRNIDTGSESNTSVTLLNGQGAVMKYNCTGVELYEGDVLKGDISIMTKDPSTKIWKPVQGTLRLKISK